MADKPVSDDPAMADILASIKRIVAEEDRLAHHPSDVGDQSGEIFDLTPDMRTDTNVENDLRMEEPETVTPTIDEAAVADIARTVIREELNGQLGVALTRNIKALVRQEVAQAIKRDEG